MSTLPLADLVGQAIFPLIPPGSALEAYMLWACQRHPSPPEYHLGVILSLAVHELARRGFSAEDGIPLQLWTTLVGGSSSGKTTAINMGEDFIRSVWKESNSEPKIDPWMAPDGSIAGIFAVLQDQYEPNRGTSVGLVVDHEFSQLIQTREAVTEFLCKLYDGRDVQRNLRENQKATKAARGKVSFEVLKQPRFSMILASSEDSLAKHFTETMAKGGLFPRMWWLAPPRGELHFVEGTYPAERELAIDAWTGWLMLLSMMESEGNKVLSLSPEAKDCLKTAQRQARHGTTASHIRGLDRAKVLALLFAAMAGRTVAKLEDMQHALVSCDLGNTGITRLALLGSPEVLRWCARVQACANASPDGVSRRELYMKCRLTKKQLDETLDNLLDMRAIAEDRTGPFVRYLCAETEQGKKLVDKPRIVGGIVKLSAPGEDEPN